MNDTTRLEELKKTALICIENLLKAAELSKKEFGSILRKEAGEENKDYAEKFANFDKTINEMIESDEIVRFNENCGKFIGIVQKRKGEIEREKIRNEFEQEEIRKKRIREQLQFLKDDSKNPQGKGDDENYVDRSKKNDIDKIESLLTKTKGKVSEQKLNEKLGTNDWREKIRSTSDTIESQRKRFDIEDTIEELSKEIICDCCGKTKSPIISYDIPNENKVFCSYDCKSDWEKKEGKGTFDKQRNKKNYGRVFGGIIILALIFALIIWLFSRKNKQRQY